MAYKLSPNSLIHCDECGEDYSATYRRCPFCGARNAPPPAPSPEYEPEPGRPAAPADPDDTYVFDGQDLFDDKDEDGYTSAHPRGGKRLAEKPSSNPFANADINWPRMITFICSLIIIVAAMVIVFTVVYPQLRGNPAADSTETPSLAVTDPGTPATDPGTAVTDPGADPSLDVPPADPGGLTALSFGGSTDNDFTLQPGESHTITLVFNPGDWSGTVTWTSSDTSCATVDGNGKVTNVNSTDGLRTVIITVSAGGFELESKVYCRGVAAATEPPATQPPASDPPATQPPSGPGGRQGTVNAAGGLNVRSGPGTTYGRIASLANGTAVNILEDAGGGWYKISFTGAGGAATEGYVLGEYISTN